MLAKTRGTFGAWCWLWGYYFPAREGWLFQLFCLHTHRSATHVEKNKHLLSVMKRCFREIQALLAETGFPADAETKNPNKKLEHIWRGAYTFLIKKKRLNYKPPGETTRGLTFFKKRITYQLPFRDASVPSSFFFSIFSSRFKKKWRCRKEVERKYL